MLPKLEYMLQKFVILSFVQMARVQRQIKQMQIVRRSPKMSVTLMVPMVKKIQMLESIQDTNLPGLERKRGQLRINNNKPIRIIMEISSLELLLELMLNIKVFY